MPGGPHGAVVGGMDVRPKVILVLLVSLLLAAVGLQLAGSYLARRADSAAREPAVFSALNEIGSRAGTPLPVAASEFLTKEVERTLRYTSVASYSFEAGSVTLYAALWAPDSVSIREVAFHTPDHCWIANGWKRLQKIQPDGADRVVDESQQRLFEKGGQRVYTACWHVAGGRCVVYNEDGPPDNFSMISDFSRFGLAQRRSQLFVRLTSSVPLKDIHARGYIREIIEALDKGMAR